jgi:MFS transporter, DHA2 family, multidrug resistance protein
MLVPVGILAYLGLRPALPADGRPSAIELDWTGFLAPAAAMAALQLVLARGVRLDWFSSTEILLECLMAAIAFCVFIVHCLTAKAPFLNLRLLRDRNYAVGLALATIYGMLNFTPMVLLPPLLQQKAGFSDALVGQVVGCRGLGMTGHPHGGPHQPLHPRIGMRAGFLMQVLSGAWMLTFDLNVTVDIQILNSRVLGFSVGLIWVPLSVFAFETLAPGDRAEASAVFHLLRNIGSSFFISLSIAEIVQATGANCSRMAEMISPYNNAFALLAAGMSAACRASPQLPRKSTGKRP